MGDESSGCYAIVGGLVAKVHSNKVTKVFVGAHCCASPQRLVNLISQRREGAKFFKFFIKRTVCHLEERRITQETRQRLAILFEEYWM